MATISSNALTHIDDFCMRRIIRRNETLICVSVCRCHWSEAAASPQISRARRSTTHTHTTRYMHIYSLLCRIIMYYILLYVDLSLTWLWSWDFGFIAAFNTNTHTQFYCNIILFVFRLLFIIQFGFGKRKVASPNSKKKQKIRL